MDDRPNRWMWTGDVVHGSLDPTRRLRFVCALVYPLVCALAAASCTAARPSTETLGDGDETAGDDGAVTPPFDARTCGDWLDHPELIPSVQPPPTPSEQCEAAPNCVALVERALQHGLDHTQYAAVDPTTATCAFDRTPGANDDCELQWFGASVAVGDPNGDGWPDLFFTRLGAPDVLYLNRGDGTFEDASADAGLDDCTFTNGAAFGDVDDDGDQDLLVSALGGPAHRLYINDGAGHFVDEAAARGVALDIGGPHGGMGVTFGDYDLDGDLDVHINEWLRPRHMARATSLEPEAWPVGSRLLRNDGTGHFEDVTDPAGVTLLGRSDDGAVFGFASTFVDLDDDGWPELAVAADYQTSALFWGGADGRFDDGTDAAGVNLESNAMGSAFGDYDRDGDLDWFVTSIAQRSACANEPCPWLGTGNRLYRNEGDRTFSERSEFLDLRDAGWGWGAAFFDLDLDGDLDLAATNGWPGPDLQGGRVFLATPARLWVTDAAGARPTDEAARRGFADEAQGRGLVPVDVDLDGDLDLVVANHAGPPRLFINQGVPGRRALRVRARGGAGSHGEARGAVVRVWPELSQTPLVQQVGVGAHFGASGPLDLWFGVGGRDRVARVEVRWPASGRTLVRDDVAVDALLVVDEADGI